MQYVGADSLPAPFPPYTHLWQLQHKWKLMREIKVTRLSIFYRLQSCCVWSRRWFGGPASVLYEARGKAIDTRDMRYPWSHYYRRRGHLCGYIPADFVSHQCRLCTRYSQRSCFHLPRAPRVNHLLVFRKYFPCILDLLQFRHSSACFRSLASLCVSVSPPSRTWSSSTLCENYKVKFRITALKKKHRKIPLP